MRPKADILYVDDEPNNLFAFKSVFRRSYNVYTASGGAEAIELLNTKDFDLVLSDYRMPEMTGVDLCKYVMKNFPSLKRIIITGFIHEEDIQNAVEVGIVSKSIAKPWDTENLNDEIQSILS